MAGTNRKVIVIQRRDLLLLVALAILRFVDREQAKVVAGFRSTTRANARLLLLSQAGYLRRTFVGTISGGRKALYALTEQGATAAGIELATIKRPTHQLRQGDFYYEHQLRLNEIYLRLQYPAEPEIPQLLRWQTFVRPISETVPLIPDAYAELKTSTTVVPCFVEVDLGTETRRILQQKIDSYLSLAVSGVFAQNFHHAQFRVLVITNSARRLHHLRQQIAKRTGKIFWLTTFEQIERHELSARIWLRPAEGEPQTLT